MRELTYLEAIREALAEEMARDPKVFVLGEDVGEYGGAFQITKGLYEKYGERRVLADEWSLEEADAEARRIGLSNEKTRAFARDYLARHSQRQ